MSCSPPTPTSTRGTGFALTTGRGNEVQQAATDAQRPAVACIRELTPFDPWWVEEPTSPDDVLGHAAIVRAITSVRVATGNTSRIGVMVKQLLQAPAVDVLQVNAARVAEANENVATLLPKAKLGCRSARTRVASAGANWSSTRWCSTSSRPAGR